MNKKPSESFKKIVFFSLISSLILAVVFVAFFLKEESAEDVEYEVLFPKPPPLPGITEEDQAPPAQIKPTAKVETPKANEPKKTEVNPIVTNPNHESIKPQPKLQPVEVSAAPIKTNPPAAEKSKPSKVFYKESPENLRADGVEDQAKDGEKMPKILKWDAVKHPEVKEYKIEIGNEETFTKSKVFYSKTNSFYTMVFPGKDYFFRVSGVDELKQEITEPSSVQVFVPVPVKEKEEEASPIDSKPEE